jgi:hypothetical protein
MKKQSLKVAHNSQPAIFFITGLAAQKVHFRQNRNFIGSPCLLSTISLAGTIIVSRALLRVTL